MVASTIREDAMLFIRRNDRREVRRAVRIPCQVVRDRGFELVSDEVLDVSPTGMLALATTATDLIVGENVFVSFRATALDIWFDTEASVVRVVRGRRARDPGRAIGLSFSGLSNVKRMILRGELRRIPPPVPRRPQRIDWAASVERIAS